MTHRFPIKEIARQSGLGTATVDRVINNRAHVSPQTRRRVAAAMDELEQQEAQLAARGRRLFFDFVVEAPARFSREVRRCAEACLPDIGAAVCRPRFLLQEIMTEAEVIDALNRIARRGSHGVCLKARDLPGIRSAIATLHDARIPVVTLVTDITSPGRAAYVGLDNASAGRTAAWLVAQTLRSATGTVLTTKSQTSFLGEEERATAFAETLSRTCPQLRIIDASGGSGVPYETSRNVARVTDQLGDLRAVYSMGGGNRAILDVLGRRPDLFIAHDLDRENRHLIGNGEIDVILHHDLQSDIRNAYLGLLRAHGLVRDPVIAPSHIQIITPENIPP